MALPAIDFAHDALLLDIDGTLLDIAMTPEAVVIPDSLRAALNTLGPKLGGALAFCSGRTLAAVDALFAPLKLAAIGSHGAELRAAPDAPIQPEAEPLSDDIKRRFADIAALEPGVRVEDKNYTLAFHYREAPQREADLLRVLTERLAALPPGYEFLRGKAIVELKRVGFNKGSGVRALMTHAPFTGRRPVFAGDDRTDEDVMAVLADFDGIGISVGRELDGAQYETGSPTDMRAWLAQLANGG
jgi:trehalose 6-phosphate phosphatase